MILDSSVIQASANRFNCKIDGDCFDRLEKYAELLIETNKQFNLTTVTEPMDVTVRHFADSLSVFGFADIPHNAKVIDVGTGAGFPGLVLLLVRPDLKLTFLDSTKKKLSFIETVLSETGVSAETLHMRAEEAAILSQYREKFDFVTARAVANMTNLSEYCLPFLKINGEFLAMKSVSSDDELSESANAIKLLGGKIESDNKFDLVENMPRRIIVLRKISQTPSAYPRASAKIAKFPIK